MDFDLAAKRLERDQTKLRGRGGPNRGAPALSEKAQKEAAYRKKQQHKMAEERARRQRQAEAMESYLHQCERNLGVKQLSKNGSLQLKATSIYGEGDKIALPPSVLETLTHSLMGNDDNSQQQQQQQPWTFRVGILNPTYSFPASPLMQSIPVEEHGHDDDDDDDDGDDDDDSNGASKTSAYLDELKHKYRAYTHATVVEFTQEEGHVGLPEPITRALLQQSSDLETMRTVDKASAAVSEDGSASMEVDGDEEEKTPGHLAWGAFDVPVEDIEITMVQLPKGRTAKLLPSEEAIRNGFYNLKDIKMVLEQSLIRTRATLSVGDEIHTWHRGTKFDLTVTNVTPATYGSVSCINTDIEIDFEAAASEALSENKNNAMTTNESATSGIPLGGRRLGEASTPALATASTTTSSVAAISSVEHLQQNLLPEPPADQKEGVVTVQIRSTVAKGQRRFDIQTATVRDLFAFAASLLGTNVAGSDAAFCLVTRVPMRRVLTLGNGGADGAQTLQQAGIAAGRELFMVEPL